MEAVVIVGAGQMGTGITQYLAMKNISVTLIDYKQSNILGASQKIENNLNNLFERGKISEENKVGYLNNITYTTDLKKSMEAELIIEAIPENFSKKENLIHRINEIVDDNTIVATNTSSLSITRLGSTFKDPSRFIGLHFFHPAVIMPLMEVVKGAETSDDTVGRVSDFIVKIEKTPIFVKDHPGFVVNRLLIPMINEAILVLQDGITSAKEIDQAMKLGSNHPMGPLELADYIGLDTCLYIMENLYKEFHDEKYRPAELLRAYVQENQLGRKTKQGFYSY